MSMGNFSPATLNGGAMGGFTLPDYSSFSLNWTPEEELIVQEGLSKYASDSSMMRYAKISRQLQDKILRDVAIHCRQMTNVFPIESRNMMKESSKKKKDQDVARKRERESGPSTRAHIAACSSAPSQARPMISIDGDDGISFQDIGGTLGHLLEQNAYAFNQISTNFTSSRNQENINLLRQARENLNSMLNELPDMSDLRMDILQIPVTLNEGLATAILSPLSIPPN